MFLTLPLVALGLALPAPKLPVVTVTASDFAFLAPATIHAGTSTFHLVNTGREMHHVVVVKLAHGKTPADYLSAMKAAGHPPAWAFEVGGVNAVIPHENADAILTLDAGDYMLACYVPSPDGVPHLMKGMVRALTVLPGKNAGAEPTPDVEARLTDFGFNLSKPLTAGRHVLRVTNDATQPHEIILIALAPHKSVKDVGNWIETGMKGPPPGKPIGGMSPLAHGRSATIPVQLAPGHYGLLCMIPDAKDGKSHFVHGMSQDVTVK